MPRRLTDLANDEVLALPLDRLAAIVLRHIVDTKQWSEHNFANDARNLGLPDQVVCCWIEALNWLVSRDLVARGSSGGGTGQAIFVTRLGYQALATGLEPVHAAARLGIEVHDRLHPARSQFLIGEYELAAFAAMREIEIRVRELARESNSLIGVTLMRRAFGDGGPLEDANLDAGERVGIRELFSGAIATFKNPSSHRQVDYADPIAASEVVLLADLLMRLLDRLEESQGHGGAP